ncbi:MAG: hypothetical protein Q8904_03485 [Bacteroidota bacterium]|nr:hypothetical protein [Bacteroidota bacterium]
MKKRYILFLWFLMIVSTLKASPSDSISTVYKNGEFVTYSQVRVNASDSISNTVTKDFVYQMHYNLDALFSWALKGLNLRKEKNELMVFYFKSTAYNKETHIIRGVGDVIVPGVITFPNIIVDSRLIEKKFTNGKNTVNINLLYSDGFLKKMLGTFTVIPQKNNATLFTLETHIRFGWFFNIFITQNRFKSIMEWRLKRLVHNLKDEAERREKNQKTVISKQLKKRQVYYHTIQNLNDYTIQHIYG